MLNVLYEDNHIIVVLKPQNIASQPDESGDVDMLTMVKNYIKETKNKPGEVFVGLVHRLDRPTGGVMVFSKTSKGASRISEQIVSGEFEKSYLAVVKGAPKQKRKTLENYLRKNPKNNTVEVVPQTVSGAKVAVLSYELLQEKQDLSLLKIALQTGRSHQIRVQLKHIGNPIVGDAKYGEKQAGVKLALWAYELKFKHPTTKQNMVFKVIPPMQSYPFNLFEIN